MSKVREKLLRKEIVVTRFADCTEYIYWRNIPVILELVLFSARANVYPWKLSPLQNKATRCTKHLSVNWKKEKICKNLSYQVHTFGGFSNIPSLLYPVLENFSVSSCVVRIVLCSLTCLSLPNFSHLHYINSSSQIISPYSNKQWPL